MIQFTLEQWREFEDYLQSHYEMDSLDIVELEMTIDGITKTQNFI